MVDSTATDDNLQKVGLIEQYVQDVIGFSSQYGSDISISYTAYNITGKPSKYPDYGDFPQAFVMRTYGRWWNEAPSRTSTFMPQSVGEIDSQDFIGRVSADFDFEDSSVTEEWLVPEDVNEYLRPVTTAGIFPSTSSTPSISRVTTKKRKWDTDITMQETELLSKVHNILENVRETKEVKNDLDILGEQVSATLKGIENRKLVLKAKRQISDVLLSIQEEDLQESENI